MRWTVGFGAPRMKLGSISTGHSGDARDTPQQYRAQDKLCEDDRGALVRDDRPRAVPQVVQVDDARVDEPSGPGHEILEPRKERRIV